MFHHVVFNREQLEMVNKVVIRDVDGWARYRVTSDNAVDHPNVRPLEYIGGVDISFIKEDNVNACATLVVINYPDLEVNCSERWPDTSFIIIVSHTSTESLQQSLRCVLLRVREG